MKRAYKLQEFVAHASNVNCLKIGKKTSRVLVTGGEDHKVNMWAIGRPNAIMSLSGHSSAVECVTFDTAEALVAAGAASGTIKLWDLEEAKIVRTLTGHRSNCISVDFHPFGEFFASGSLDTNLKIWDIRRKGCIHTYKGHTRGVNAIKFSPDGRWVVSGGEDNIVKLWDLTAGKLMHDFKCHEGQILCLDFHPHEFLLATGSADRTVKFWDLETFELIGSAGPEVSGVRSMVFNPDGRTLLAGLHENMKVFSWEPLRCHDLVDVGWSKLGDLNIHDGKLLGCSYNQSCVGIWVVDLSRVGPYAPVSNGRMNGGASIINQPSQQMVDGSLKSSNIVRATLPHMVDSSMKDMKLNPTILEVRNGPAADTASVATPQRISSTGSSKVSTMSSSTASPCIPLSKRPGATKVQPSSIVQPVNKIDVAPVVVPRHASGADPAIVRPAEINAVRPIVQTMASHTNDSTRINNVRAANDFERNVDVVSLGRKSPAGRVRMPSNSAASCAETPSDGVSAGESESVKWIGAERFRRTGIQQEEDGIKSDSRSSTSKDSTVMGITEAGRVRSVASVYDKKETIERIDMVYMPAGHGMRSSTLKTNAFMKGSQAVVEGAPILYGNESDVIEQLMQPHSSFVTSMQTRQKSLQVVRRFWSKNDLKGAVEAMTKIADDSVLVDVLSCLVDRSEVFTLEICSLLLPLLNSLLSSNLDRYITTSLTVLSLIVKSFGSIIHATRTASPSFGVDIHAEERIERCNACYLELQNTMQGLTPLLRRTGDVGKSAQDLSIALQEV